MYINPRGIAPTEIFAGAIAVYENIWENPLKDIDIINKVTSNPDSDVKFTKSQTFNDINTGDKEVQSARTNYVLYLTHQGSNNEELRKINNKFYETMVSGISSYSNIFDIEQPLKDVEDYQLLKYSGGQHYDAHYDGGTESGRAVSPIVYLNDDYEGGEIEFVNFNLKIKPKSGSLLIFPSNYAYRHIAHPVTSGTKYAIVTWLHDR
jgi:Rps23 Pro-64 3,4-dihydroxylase Tpa1-like proline 4-hydroxylase